MAQMHAYVWFSRWGFSGSRLWLIVPATHCMKVGLKYTVPGLPISENSIILGSLVLMHSQHVMDTPPAVKLCCSIAERDKN